MKQDIKFSVQCRCGGTIYADAIIKDEIKFKTVSDGICNSCGRVISFNKNKQIKENA